MFPGLYAFPQTQMYSVLQWRSRVQTLYYNRERRKCHIGVNLFLTYIFEPFYSKILCIFVGNRLSITYTKCKLNYVRFNFNTCISYILSRNAGIRREKDSNWGFSLQLVCSEGVAVWLKRVRVRSWATLFCDCLCSVNHKGRYFEECGKQSSSGAPLTSIVFFPPTM